MSFVVIVIFSMPLYCIVFSIYLYYCTHGCVCQLVIKENGGGGSGGGE